MSKPVKLRRYVVETRLETTGSKSKLYYSLPMGYREAVKLLGTMARDKHEAQLLTVLLTDDEVAEYERMGAAGVSPDYSHQRLT